MNGANPSRVITDEDEFNKYIEEIQSKSNFKVAAGSSQKKDDSAKSKTNDKSNNIKSKDDKDTGSAEIKPFKPLYATKDAKVVTSEVKDSKSGNTISVKYWDTKQSASALPFKTSQCVYYDYGAGKCSAGSKCPFLHGFNDPNPRLTSEQARDSKMRNDLQITDETEFKRWVDKKRAAFDKKDVATKKAKDASKFTGAAKLLPFKIEQCTNFNFGAGKCAHGLNCHFLHGWDDPNARFTAAQVETISKQSKTSRFARDSRTVLSLTDEAEFRELMRAKKKQASALPFKTVLCANYNNGAGNCSFGTACTFLHGYDDPRPRLNQAQADKADLRYACTLN